MNTKSEKKNPGGQWVRPEVRRLNAGSAEANSAISGRGDGVGQQES